MKHIKKFNEGFREETQEVFSKARILYPKLAKQEGGDNTSKVNGKSITNNSVRVI